MDCEHGQPCVPAIAIESIAINHIKVDASDMPLKSATASSAWRALAIGALAFVVEAVDYFAQLDAVAMPTGVIIPRLFVPRASATI